MSIGFRFLPTAVIATALVLAATGAAFAQAAGGGRGGGSSGSSSGAEPDQSRVLTYGLPGNCPPTMAGCGVVEKPKPKVVRTRVDPCGDFAIGTPAYRECKRKQ